MGVLAAAPGLYDSEGGCTAPFSPGGPPAPDSPPAPVGPAMVRHDYGHTEITYARRGEPRKFIMASHYFRADGFGHYTSREAGRRTRADYFDYGCRGKSYRRGKVKAGLGVPCTVGPALGDARSTGRRTSGRPGRGRHLQTREVPGLRHGAYPLAARLVALAALAALGRTGSGRRGHARFLAAGSRRRARGRFLSGSL